MKFPVPDDVKCIQEKISNCLEEAHCAARSIMDRNCMALDQIKSSNTQLSAKIKTLSNLMKRVYPDKIDIWTSLMRVMEQNETGNNNSEMRFVMQNTRLIRETLPRLKHSLTIFRKCCDSFDITFDSQYSGFQKYSKKYQKFGADAQLKKEKRGKKDCLLEKLTSMEEAFQKEKSLHIFEIRDIGFSASEAIYQELEISLLQRLDEVRVSDSLTNWIVEFMQLNQPRDELELVDKLMSGNGGNMSELGVSSINLSWALLRMWQNQRLQQPHQGCFLNGSGDGDCSGDQEEHEGDKEDDSASDDRSDCIAAGCTTTKHEYECEFSGNTGYENFIANQYRVGIKDEDSQLTQRGYGSNLDFTSSQQQLHPQQLASKTTQKPDIQNGLNHNDATVIHTGPQTATASADDNTECT